MKYKASNGEMYDITPNRHSLPFATTHNFQHEDYDGAPDAFDHRCGFGNSEEDCQSQIESQIENED